MAFPGGLGISSLVPVPNHTIKLLKADLISTLRVSHLFFGGWGFFFSSLSLASGWILGWIWNFISKYY